jgi:hypothetical protein
MSFGGGWVGLDRKKGGAVLFRIYSRRFSEIAPGQRSRQGRVLQTFLKSSVSYSKQYSKFANINVLVLIQNKKRARGYL